MLWLALYLPELPLEVFTRAEPASEPFVVSTAEERAPQVLIANHAALSGGVRSGMNLSAAYALVRSLCVRPRDTPAEQALLERLAAWAGQFTSQVSIDPPDALLLEVQGSLALFGDLAALTVRIHAQIAMLGFAAQSAVAPTPLAAIWLARVGENTQVTETTALAGALAPLPLRCLGLPDKQRDTLLSMGVRTVGDCLRLPRAGLARRLGQESVQALDRALGRLPDPRPYYAAPSRYQGSLALPGTVDNIEALLFGLHRLLQELAGFLLARGAGIQASTLDLHHPQRQMTRIDLGLLAPTRDAERLLMLWRERLARVELSAPVEEMTLHAPRLIPLAHQASDFFAPRHQEPAARVELIERLKARLGDAAVQGLASVAEHRPEHAWRYAAPGSPQARIAAGRRPVWLFSQPLALEQRDARPWLHGGLMLEAGPERIESGWWDGAEVRRDYFIARDERGTQLWIFRELSGERRWFVHGVFS